jgi:riboflavin synthase
LFTGLVEDIGMVELADRRSDAMALAIAPVAFAVEELDAGDSVAIDGVCLTVTERGHGRFAVLASAETLRRTTAGELRIGSRVNLERALRLGDRLGGHLVQGHVDAVAALVERRHLAENLELVFRPPVELLSFLVEKGSVAIDGISLTVNRLDSDGFSVWLIPHTMAKTTLADKKAGDRVNIEVDMIGKYVDKLLERYRRP